MGIMHKNSSSSGLSNPGASAETVVYTTPALQIGPVGPPTNPIDISGSLFVTAGTGTTAVVIRCRQGGVTGTQVGPSFTHTLAAGNSAGISFGFTDLSTFLEQVNGGSYVITVQQTGGTGAGTANAIDIKVMTLWLLLASWVWRKSSRPIPTPQDRELLAARPCGRLSGWALLLLSWSLFILLLPGGQADEGIPNPLAILGCRGPGGIYHQLGIRQVLWWKGATGLNACSRYLGRAGRRRRLVLHQEDELTWDIS